ncbi:sugar-binding protein [Akkermansia massiliensis]
MKLSFIILSLTSGLAFSAAPRELSFYVVSPVEGKAPVVDGSLNDAAWEKATAFRNYYIYNCTKPTPGKLKTEFRMLYDVKGIYLGIINFEEHPEKLRKIITDFDSAAIWTDDCAEFFFDARANGISYHCFKVNCIGPRADFRRRDAAVYQNDWSGTDCPPRTSIGKDRWTIEAFFPWSDLPAKAEMSDIWMFCHARYAYTGGNFAGATSSVLGGYSSPRNFGYIYFKGANDTVSPEKVSVLLSRSAEEPWCAMAGDTLIMRDKGKSIFTEFDQAGENEFVKIEKLSAELARVCGESALKKYREELDAINRECHVLKKEKITLSGLRNLYVLKERCRALKWKIALEESLN